MSAATQDQKNFYQKNRQRLIREYLSNFPLRIDPDAVRDLFMEIGYDRTSVKRYEEVCGLLIEDIFYEALNEKLEMESSFSPGGCLGRENQPFWAVCRVINLFSMGR